MSFIHFPDDVYGARNQGFAEAWVCQLADTNSSNIGGIVYFGIF